MLTIHHPLCVLCFVQWQKKKHTDLDRKPVPSSALSTYISARLPFLLPDHDSFLWAIPFRFLWWMSCLVSLSEVDRASPEETWTESMSRVSMCQTWGIAPAPGCRGNPAGVSLYQRMVLWIFLRFSQEVSFFQRGEIRLMQQQYVCALLAIRKWSSGALHDQIPVCSALVCLPLVSSKSGSLSFIPGCNKDFHTWNGCCVETYWRQRSRWFLL